MLQDVANAAGFNLDYSRVEGEYTLKLNRKVKEDINDQMSVTINNMGKMAITILPQSYLMGHKLNQETNQQNKIGNYACRSK
ncbi:MAG: hypothetical protein KatS3mg083_258 [Candidatus Dojkabacteria bacterium]|nr:MAG: hypothetical protein KatS3mg083_258 [Candidatus Dojkabacteria bacterium]